MADWPQFAVGDDYDVFDEFTLLEAGNERDWSLTLARLCQVARLGVSEANSDSWSPPSLYLCKFGKLSTIYAVKPSANVGADVLVLVCADFGQVRAATGFENTARPRLGEADF